jgi:MacB-like periplasmic core domain
MIMVDWKQIVRRQLAPLRLPPAREIEIVEELALHLESVYEEALGRGATESEARAGALGLIADGRLLECELGRVEQPAATRWLSAAGVESLERKGGMRMESLWQDLRFSARMLVKNPGFVLIAVLTLALGIGVNTAIFSVVNAVLLRPLPYRNPADLVLVRHLNKVKGTPSVSVSYPDFLDWKAQNRVFEDLTTFRQASFSLAAGDDLEQIRAANVSANFFQMLGSDVFRGERSCPKKRSAEAKMRRSSVTRCGNGVSAATRNSLGSKSNWTINLLS